jgi:hypothetical protein
MKYQKLSYAIAMSMGLLTTPLALADLKDGLIAYYPFDGNAQDASGNGNDSVVHGAKLTTDRFGNNDSAYYFDGNSYIQTPVNSNQKPVSFSVWFQADNVNGIHSIVDSDVAYHFGHSLIIGYVDNDGDLDIQYHDSYIDTGYTIKSGQWHHAVVNYSDKIQLYVDGHLVAEQPYPDAVFDGSQFRFGRHNAEGPQWFVGKMDNIHFYDRALSEEEIQALYTAVPDDSDCVHATYSLKKRTLTVPFVEMPVIDFLTGQPTGEMELWTGNLRLISGTTNRFRLLNKTVAQITDGSSSSCPATYAVETGTLSIPYIDVPTGIAVGNQKIENGVEVFKATLTWDPIGRSFVVQEVEQLSSNPETPKSCADLKANDAATTDGLYKIDPDGTGGNQPFKVYCDMTTDDGGWTLIFRHDASEGYFSGIDEAANVNQNNPGLSTKKYSILNQLESFKRNGQFQFRINWPGYTQKNIWTQTSNPTDDVDVAGYQGISVDSTSNYWGGLELSNGSHDQTNNNGSYLDGSVNHWNWYYAIGSYRQWGGTEGCYNALPAANDVAGHHCGVQTVELWVK